jgi:hypothetical protein
MITPAKDALFRLCAKLCYIRYVVEVSTKLGIKNIKIQKNYWWQIQSYPLK